MISSVIEIQAIWAEMEAQKQDDKGQVHVVRRRLSGEHDVDCFIGLSFPQQERFFYFSVATEALPGPRDFPETRGFRCERAAMPDSESPSIVLRLQERSLQDLFTSLVLDLLLVVSSGQTEERRVAEFLTRLRKWQYFMKGFHEEGLSRERQRGLYGELHVLASTLIPRYGPSIVTGWTGPDAAHQDFQFMGCGIEVKTCVQKKPQMIMIANERELDDAPFRQLFLWHISLNENSTNGETLNEEIAKVRSALSCDPSALTVYEDKIRAYGYLDSQAHLYEFLFFSVRQEVSYHVYEGFPRLLECDLMSGVGNVTYAISIDSCDPFLIESPVLFELIGKENGDE